MELKLNVYKGNEVEKTYTTSEINLQTGVCEDILEIVNIDKFENLDSQELAVEVLKLVSKGFAIFKPLLKEVFVGITDEELRRTRVKEIGSVIINIISFTLTELFNVNKEKN